MSSCIPSADPDHDESGAEAEAAFWFTLAALSGERAFAVANPGEPASAGTIDRVPTELLLPSAAQPVAHLDARSRSWRRLAKAIRCHQRQGDRAEALTVGELLEAIAQLPPKD